jgi:hypothetical protein
MTILMGALIAKKRDLASTAHGVFKTSSEASQNLNSKLTGSKEGKS